MEKRFKSFRLRKHATTGNIVDRVKNIESSASDRFNEQARAQSLDVVSERTGTLIADALVSPAQDVTVVEPTDSSFTGVAMGGEGWTFNSVIWHFVAVAAGVLQAGFNYLGQFIAGAGAVTLDADGISITSASSYTSSGAVKFASSGVTNAAIYMNKSGTPSHEVVLDSFNITGDDSFITIISSAAAGKLSSIYLQAKEGSVISEIAMGRSIIINNAGEDINTFITANGGATIATFDAGLGTQTNELGMVINNSSADSDTVIRGDTDANLFRADASTDRVGIGTATPATKLDVNGTITGTGLVIGGATLAVIDEGTYTPTITGVTNVAASTAQTCFYLRVGTKVTVWGGCAIDPTAAGNTVFGISLPVASNLALARNLVGHVARAGASDEIGTIEGDTTNDRANVTYTAAVTTNHNVLFNFSYTII